MIVSVLDIIILTRIRRLSIDDLRKTNFDRIPPYLTNKKPITLWLKYPQKDIELDNYYRFTWKLSYKDSKNPYEIYLDNRYSLQTITPKWFIDKLFEDRHSDKSKNFGSAANFLDTLSKQLSARESTFVYELCKMQMITLLKGKWWTLNFILQTIICYSYTLERSSM